MKMGLIYLESY